MRIHASLFTSKPLCFTKGGLLALLCLTLLSDIVVGSEISLSRNTKRWFLVQEEDSVDIDLQDILNWSEKEIPITLFSKLERMPEVDVTSLLPDYFSQFKTSYRFSGPNCHNTSLISIGARTFPSYVGEEEIESVLENFCVSIETSFVKSGDLGLINNVRNTSRTPIHSFIVTTESYYFNKEGNENKRGYAFGKISELIQQFNIAPDCVGVASAPNLECKRELKYYRCNIDQPVFTGFQDSKSFRSNLHTIERDIFNLLTGRGNISTGDIPGIKRRIRNVMTSIEYATCEPNKDCTSQKEYTYARLRSHLSQLDNIDLTKYGSKSIFRSPVY